MFILLFAARNWSRVWWWQHSTLSCLVLRRVSPSQDLATSQHEHRSPRNTYLFTQHSLSLVFSWAASCPSSSPSRPSPSGGSTGMGPSPGASSPTHSEISSVLCPGDDLNLEIRGVFKFQDEWVTDVFQIYSAQSESVGQAAQREERTDTDNSAKLCLS